MTRHGVRLPFCSRPARSSPILPHSSAPKVLSRPGANWTKTRDFRVLRNLVAVSPPGSFTTRVRATARQPERSAGQAWPIPCKEILYAPDPIWHDASQPVYDPRSLAWMARDDLAALRPYLTGRKTGVSETVNVSYPSPEQAVLDVTLDSPGLVVLADVDYPGWELTIDGSSAPIYRVNGAMRGAAVSAGRHRLVYTYAPRSFKIGRLVSIGGLATLMVLGVACRRWPCAAILGAWDESSSDKT